MLCAIHDNNSPSRPSLVVRILRLVPAQRPVRQSELIEGRQTRHDLAVHLTDGQYGREPSGIGSSDDGELGAVETLWGQADDWSRTWS
jgi:hypothetical protein